MTESEQDDRIGKLHVRRNQARRKLVCLRGKATELADEIERNVGDALVDLRRYADQTRNPLEYGGVTPTFSHQFPTGNEVKEVLDEIVSEEDSLWKVTEALRFAGALRD